MLSRRQLRSKCLQALYAYFQSDNTNIATGEKELIHSIDKVYDLYLYQLSLLMEVVAFADLKLQDAKQKRLPTPENLNPNTKFVDNKLIAKLKINRQLQQALAKNKISWTHEKEYVENLFQEIKKSPEYDLYINSGENSFDEDKNFIIKAFKKHIAESELVEQYFEEKSIYWSDDIELVDSMVVKTFKSFSESSDEFHPVLKLYNDEEEDKEYVLQLFRKAIIHSGEYEKIIAEKTQNWEVERIALMDILIMKMAICELLNFSSIPVKVTLNEYIDISKRFSTPKSKVFVNGILDKLIADFKAMNKIIKTGRGLLE
ncbi:MAG: transcription antitermination factor NusB [Bacteroidetes bacterium]|nr:transcription antitermination factor NusB [Bacteroidota bacterium]HET6244371.1 transcription antitermination factor NusB [Bacteroidia bacterium]